MNKTHYSSHWRILYSLFLMALSWLLMVKKNYIFEYVIYGLHKNVRFYSPNVWRILRRIINLSLHLFHICVHVIWRLVNLSVSLILMIIFHYPDFNARFLHSFCTFFTIICWCSCFGIIRYFQCWAAISTGIS